MRTGYFANRFGILGKDAQKWLSRLLINITCPALILSSVTTSERLSSNQMLLMIFAAAIIYYLALPFIAKVLSLNVTADKRSEYQNFRNAGRFQYCHAVQRIKPGWGLYCKRSLFVHFILSCYNSCYRAAFVIGRQCCYDYRRRARRIDKGNRERCRTEKRPSWI